MYIRNQIIAAITLIVVTMSWPLIAATESQTDIRVLIDVSGSMKQNDPNSLRQPALRLLTGLLPTGSEAGVWTFGQFVNMLVLHGRVDNDWKDQARRASKTINSHGLYTNIEDTLRDATWDWNKIVPTERRTLILLTDGLVDIANDAQLNQASRERILNDILPKLQQSGINIHTIALSNDADEPLLRQLSSATQGSFTRATTAQELERIFLRMFETSAETETLPLNNNTIQVDNSVSEMTLLIFHQPNTPPTEIILPDDSRISQMNTPKEISWHHEKNYDLITIQKPPMGTWTIDATMDPDNRALVVTDLKLKSDQLPANIGEGDQFTLEIRLSENEKPIINKDFLHFIKVTATQTDRHGEQQKKWSLLDNGLRNDSTENDGIYTLHLDKSLTTGRHELTIDVDGTTFHRQQRLHFEVFKHPIISAIETPPHGAPALYISPISGLIDPDSMQALVTIDNEETPRPVPRQHQNEWQLELDNLDSDKRHSLSINITGSRNDKDINIRLEPIFFGEDIATLQPSTPEPEISPATVPTESRDHSTDEAETKTTHATPDEDRNSLGTNILIILQVLIFNALAAGGIFILYRKYKAKLHPKSPIEELTNE